MSRHKYPGHFVSIESGEGAGKTSLINNLKNMTKGMDDIIYVNDPSKDLRTTRMLRKLLLSSEYDLERETELLLYVAARCELAHKIIMPALKEGKLVISDRFDLSTWAYQAVGRGMDKGCISMLHHLIGDLSPDMFVVLDIDPALGVRRSKTRLAVGKIDEGMFEDLDLSFHQKILTYMCGAASKDDRGRIIKILPEKTQQEVLKEFLELLEAEDFI